MAGSADDWLKAVTKPPEAEGAPAAPEGLPAAQAAPLTTKDQSRAPGMGSADAGSADAWLQAVTKPPEPPGAPGTPGAPKGGDLGTGNALAGGFIEGIPMVGPRLIKGIDQALAWGKSQVEGTDYDEELAAIERNKEATQKVHSTAKTVGNVGGQVAGYAAMAAAAPWAFGEAAATGLGAATTSAVTSGVVAGIDAAARGEDPVMGVVTGAAGGALARPLAWLFGNVIAPRVLHLGQRALDNGIHLTGDMVSNNPLVRLLRNVPGYGGEQGAGPGYARAAREWRLAVNREMGATNGADNVLPETMESARQNTSALFQRVAGQAQDLPMDRNFQRVVQDVWDSVNTPTAMGSPVWREGGGEERKVMQLLQYIMRPMRQGNINGPWRLTPQQYLEMTDSHSGLGQWIGTARGRANPNVQDVATRLKDGLDELLAANLPRDAVADLAQARRQWWAMKTVEPLAEEFRATGGLIPPERLAGAVRQNSERYAYGSGGNLADLGDIGASFLKSAPDRNMDVSTALHWLGRLGMSLTTGGAAGIITHGLGYVGGAAAAIPALTARVVGTAMRRPTTGTALIRGASGQGGRVGNALAGVRPGAAIVGGQGIAGAGIPYARERLNALVGGQK